MEAFGILEGGGAKGLAHVGALKAAEQRGIRFTAIAGASAGALVGALAAAGFTPDDLYDPATGRGLLALDPDAVFGKAAWAQVAAVRDEVARLRATSAAGFWLRLPWLWLKYRRALTPQTGFGLIDTRGFAQWLDGHLRRRLGLARAPLFSDLPVPLKVVATEIGSGAAKVFGREETPAIPVAEAVAASLAIPFVFQPLRVGGARYVDGGVVSNFPVWLLDGERAEAGPHRPSFGFSLSAGRPQPPAEGPASLIDFVAAIVRAAVFGGAYLEVRGVENFHRVVVPASVSVLKLDLTGEERRRVYREGMEGAEQFFRTMVGPRPATAMAEALDVMRAHAAGRLAAATGAAPRHLRVHVMLPAARGALRVMYSAGFGEDADDRLLVRIGAGGPGLAFTRREPVATDMGVALTAARAHYGLDKYIRALIRPSLKAMISVPVFASDRAWELAARARETPIGVLNFDSDEPLVDAFADPQLGPVWAILARFAARELQGG